MPGWRDTLLQMYPAGLCTAKWHSAEAAAVVTGRPLTASLSTDKSTCGKEVGRNRQSNYREASAAGIALHCTALHCWQPMHDLEVCQQAWSIPGKGGAPAAVVKGCTP